MKKNPVIPQEVPSAQRICNFEEVIAVYTEAEALREASRCLQCKNAPCIGGCPVGIDIKKFIAQISQKDYRGAYLTIRDKNDFPSICGRVCPAEYQCRKSCVFTKKGLPYAAKDAIQINFLERFAGDFGIENNLDVPTEKNARLARHTVAVVGSGPAGLCAAGQLARHGVRVIVYEALHKPGGVLRYGIPPFRLPRNILDVEIATLKKLGVEIITNHVVGKTKTLSEHLAGGISAAFLGLGAGVPAFLKIPGEDLCNVYSANEFLTRVNLMSAYKFPEYHTPVNVGKHIVVIGGGNTAMDAARAALRLQKMNNIPPDTSILYRRTELELPARRLEIEHAQQEGIRFEYLVRPDEFTGDPQDFVQKLRCTRCSLGETDATGRRRPVPIEGSGFELSCDMAIIAVGLRANQLLTRVTPELKTDAQGDVIINSQTMETSLPGVYAGGDIVGGEGTVIEAMGMAKRAAAAILERLKQM